MKENILKCIDTLKKKHILSDSIFTGIGFGISDLKKSHFPHEVVDKNDFGLLHIQILEQWTLQRKKKYNKGQLDSCVLAILCIEWYRRPSEQGFWDKSANR